MPNDVSLSIERIGLSTARVTMRCGEIILETLLPAAELQSLSRLVLKPSSPSSTQRSARPTLWWPASRRTLRLASSSSAFRRLPLVHSSCG